MVVGNVFLGVLKMIFPGGPKVVKFHFTHLKLWKQTFLLNL